MFRLPPLSDLGARAAALAALLPGVADALALGFALGLLLGLAESPVLRDVLTLVVPAGVALLLTRVEARPPPGTPALAVVGLTAGLATGIYARVGDVALDVAVQRRVELLRSLEGEKDDVRVLLTRWIMDSRSPVPAASPPTPPASPPTPPASPPTPPASPSAAAASPPAASPPPATPPSPPPAVPTRTPVDNLPLGAPPPSTVLISDTTPAKLCVSRLPRLLAAAEDATTALDYVLSEYDQDTSLAAATTEIQQSRAAGQSDAAIRDRLSKTCPAR
jgi:hypothetical protein